jgi:predicted metalloenzyme YecM
MEENVQKAKRVRKTKEEAFNDKIAKLDEKIALYQAKIEAAQREKEELLNPALSVKDITDKIKELNLPLEEVMKAVDKIAKKQ